MNRILTVFDFYGNFWNFSDCLDYIRKTYTNRLDSKRFIIFRMEMNIFERKLIFWNCSDCFDYITKSFVNGTDSNPFCIFFRMEMIFVCDFFGLLRLHREISYTKGFDFMRFWIFRRGMKIVDNFSTASIINGTPI